MRIASCRANKSARDRALNANEQKIKQSHYRKDVYNARRSVRREELWPSKKIRNI